MLILVIFLRKMLILVKICKYLDFGQHFRKISILVKNVENLDFDGNFREISNLVKIFEQSRSWPKWSKILDFGHNLPKCRFWSKLKEILILIQIFEECRLGPKLTKLLIWDKTEENVDFRLFSFSKFPKISILSKLSKNVGLEILILVKIIEKSEIWSKLSKKLDFGKNCRKLSILV